MNYLESALCALEKIVLSAFVVCSVYIGLPWCLRQ